MPSHSISHRAAHATWWSALEITARYGVQIIVTAVLARLLDPTDFGMLAMLLVFTSFGALLADAGFGSALIQRQGTGPDDEATVFWFSAAIGLAAAVVLYACARPIALFYHQPPLAEFTRAIAWVLPLGAIGAVPDALLTKRLDFKARALAQTLASVLSGVIAVVLALRGFGVWSLIVQSLLAASLRSMMLWVLSKWRPLGRFRMQSFRALFGFGGFMLLSGLLNTVSTRIQSLMIGRLFDAGTLGYYTLAQNASSVPTNLIGAVLGRIGLPVFAQLAVDKARLRETLHTSLSVSMFVFVPCMVGIALVAGPLINLVYGPRWLAAAPILSLLALSGALWPLHVLNLAALSAQGRSDRFFRLEVLKNIFIVIVTLATAPFGVIAVAAAMLLAGIFSVTVNTWYSHRMLGYGMLAQLRDQRPVFMLATMAAAPAWAILHWTARGVWPTLLAIVVAIAVYIGLAILFRIAGWTQLLAIIKQLLNSHATATTSDSTHV